MEALNLLELLHDVLVLASRGCSQKFVLLCDQHLLHPVYRQHLLKQLLAMIGKLLNALHGGG